MWENPDIVVAFMEGKDISYELHMDQNFRMRKPWINSREWEAFDLASLVYLSASIGLVASSSLVGFMVG